MLTRRNQYLVEGAVGHVEGAVGHSDGVRFCLEGWRSGTAIGGKDVICCEIHIKKKSGRNHPYRKIKYEFRCKCKNRACAGR
jgi:hypothetical protein